MQRLQVLSQTLGEDYSSPFLIKNMASIILEESVSLGIEKKGFCFYIGGVQFVAVSVICGSTNDSAPITRYVPGTNSAEDKVAENNPTPKVMESDRG